MNALSIQGGRVVDPANGVDEVRDLTVVDGKINRGAAPAGATVIDAKGKLVVPGLIDLHVHFREPGRSDKETVATGAACAARGGFTSVVCMPNTSPAADNTGTIAYIKQKAATAPVNVFPAGAISRELKGEELAPIGSLQRAGVVAVTDDGHCVQNNELMRRAVQYAKMFALPVFDHCQDYNLVADGVMHEGHWSIALGLRGWPACGEDVMVARDILLAELNDWWIHCQHVSSARSVSLIREAKQRGVKISAEACPHHFTLTDESVKGYDTNFKVNPPLRSERDRDAVRAGLADGTINCIASDHAPHCRYEKEVEFDFAPFGMIGLETSLALSLELVRQNVVSLPRLIEKMTINPARLLGLAKGTLADNADADLTIIDQAKAWTYDVEQSASKSRNSPFHGWKLHGKAVMTIRGGAIVWREE